MCTRRIIVLIGLSLLISSVGREALAQACCSGGTPLTSNLGVRQLPKGQMTLGLSYDYNTQRALVKGRKKLDDRFRRRNTHAVLLNTQYGLSDRFSLIGLFSWVRQEEDNRTLSGEKRFVNAAGIGDIIGLLQYELFSGPRGNLQIAAGMKVPVGKTDVTDPATDILLNADLQPGTGSWDGLAVLHFSQVDLFGSGLNADVSAIFRLTTDDQRFNGQQTYRFGNETQVYFGLSDQFVLGYGLLSPQLMFRYRRTGTDLTDGIMTPNTGGEWVFAVPGVSYQMSSGTGLSLVAEIPVYRNLTGVQLTTSYRITLGITYILD